MYTYYFEVVDETHFKLIADNSPGSAPRLGRVYPRFVLDWLFQVKGFSVVILPRDFSPASNFPVRCVPGYLTPKPITVESVDQFVQRMTAALTNPTLPMKR